MADWLDDANVSPADFEAFCYPYKYVI